MENNFRILRTGGELSSQGATPNNNGGGGVNWPMVFVSTVVFVGVGVMMYNVGKKSLIPDLEAANKEKERLNESLANCPYRKGQSASSAKVI